MMRLIFFIFFYITCHHLIAQDQHDPWLMSHLKRICWKQTFEGVLADYHPVTITLLSDSIQVAGYLRHKGDDRVHRLLGDWSRKDKFQLQERDEYDRLTGYLRGSMSGDQLRMEWMSADHSRVFDIVAYPATLIKIKNFKPVAEWIRIDVVPEVWISVQKMDYGIVSGIAKRNKEYSRFDGYCLDGTCSIWNTVLQNPGGAPIKVQMRQKDAGIYKAVLDGKEYSASIETTLPLIVRHHDNSMGFLDFVYPDLQSESMKLWLGKWIDKVWNDGVTHLSSINIPGTSGRLVHRSTGWIEVIDATEDYVSGMITFINPGLTRRESFVWLRKEDEFIGVADLLNVTSDVEKAGSIALKRKIQDPDEDYCKWLNTAGYDFVVPSRNGLLAFTEFNMIYGDDIQPLTIEESKAMVKKKYWKYFDW